MNSSIAYYLVDHVIKSNYFDGEFYAIFLCQYSKYPGITLAIRSQYFGKQACQFITP